MQGRQQWQLWAAAKSTSSEWSLAVLVPELVVEMRSLQVALSGTWFPREDTAEADRLGNLEPEVFSLQHELKVALSTHSGGSGASSRLPPRLSGERSTTKGSGEFPEGRSPVARVEREVTEPRTGP